MKISQQGYHRRRQRQTLIEARAGSARYSTGWHLERLGYNRFEIRITPEDGFGPRGQVKHAQPYFIDLTAQEMATMVKHALVKST